MEEKREYPVLQGRRFHKNACVLTNTSLFSPGHTSMSGICSNCIMCGMCEVGYKAKNGRTLFPGPFGTAQFGAEKILANIEDLQILPELYGPGMFFGKVHCESRLGGFKSKLPVIMSAMGSTKVASDKNTELTTETAKAGITRVIGENYFVSFGEGKLNETIDLYRKNRIDGYGGIVIQINANEHKLGLDKVAARLGADAIEFKVGQGAKQGLGGEIKFDDASLIKKFEAAGFEVVKTPDGKFERHAFPGSLSDSSLRETLIEYSKHNLPIWIKTGMGRGINKLIEALERIKKEDNVPIKCLTVDGFGGGTGMSPWFVMNEMNIPSGALFTVLKKKPSFDVLLSGGYSTGADVAKAMMLGADGVGMARALMIAARQPNGIENFSKAIAEELQMISVTQKVDSVSKLVGRRKSLFALSSEARRMFGIPDELKDVL